MSWLAFIGALALLTVHELDAVERREWRILPLLRRLPDRTGFAVFIIGHMPLFGVIFWLMSHPDAVMRTGLQVGLSVFCVVHAGLHKVFETHEEYRFHGALSRLLIWGCAVMGAASMMLYAAGQ